MYQNLQIKKDFYRSKKITQENVSDRITLKIRKLVNLKTEADGNNTRAPTVICRILLLSEAELLQPLLLRHGVIDEGAGLLFRLASPAADHTINPTVQDVEALLGEAARVQQRQIPLVRSGGSKTLGCNLRERRCCSCGCWRLNPEAPVCRGPPPAEHTAPGLRWS